MNKKGFALLLVFAVLTALSAMLIAFLAMVSGEIRSVRAGLHNIQAFYIAEAGLAKARRELTTGEQAIGWGETNNDPFGTGTGTYIVTTAYSDAPTNEHVTITSEGYIPDSTGPLAQRRIVESDIPLSGTAGANLSLGATASASSEAGNFFASKAIDGAVNTKWKADTSGNAWLKLDFGSSTTFSRIVINGQKNISSSTIEYSSNDSDYDAVTNLVEDPGWTFTFDEVEARYLRFNIIATKTPEVNEIETYSVSGIGRGEFSTSW